jgi:type II secretory pathway pseudopilin PulG
MKMKKHLNNKGFSLTELMVTVGLLGGMSIYILDLVSGIRETEKQTLAFFSIATTTMDITNALQNEDNCTATLGGLDPTRVYPDAVSISDITRTTSGITGSSSRTIYSEGQIIDRLNNSDVGGGVIQIDSMLLSKYATATPELMAQNQAYVTVSFKVGAAADRSDGIGIDWDTMSNAQKVELRNRVGSMPVVIKRIPIQYQLVEGGTTIERCNAGGFWTDFLNEVCVNVLSGTYNPGANPTCTNIKIIANTDPENPDAVVEPETMLLADGRYQVDDAHKTQFLKVGGNFSDYTMNTGFNVQLENSLWTDALRVGDDNVTAPGSGNVSFSGTFYIGQFNRARPYRRSLRLGNAGQPGGIEVMGNNGPATEPITESIIVNSEVVRMLQPAIDAAYPVGTSNADRMERADAARAGWVAQAIAKVLSADPVDINAIMDEISSNADATGLAGAILKRYICINTHMIRFSSRDAREQDALPTAPQFWVAGQINPVTGGCEFGIPGESGNNLHLKRNCSQKGNCHAIEAQNSICINGACKTRWPYVVQDSLCNWKISCAANEMIFASRPDAGVPERSMCCQVRFEN